MGQQICKPGNLAEKQAIFPARARFSLACRYCPGSFAGRARTTRHRAFRLRRLRFAQLQAGAPEVQLALKCRAGATFDPLFIDTLGLGAAQWRQAVYAP
jgi:hypothetical protein